MNLYECFESKHDQIKTSINLKRDLSNKALTNSYYPSYQTLLKLEKLISNFNNKRNGSFIVNGAYGTGKSYYILMLMHLLLDNDQDKNNLLNKFDETHNIKNTVNKLKNKKYIPVFFNDIFKDFYYSLISGINLSIQENNLDVELNSVYLNIVKKIDSWKENQMHIYDNLKENIKRNGLSVEEFKEKLLQFDIESLLDFKRYYKEIGF